MNQTFFNVGAGPLFDSLSKYYPCPFSAADYEAYNTYVAVAVARGNYPNVTAHYITSDYSEARRYNAKSFDVGHAPALERDTN